MSGNNAPYLTGFMKYTIYLQLGKPREIISHDSLVTFIKSIVTKRNKEYLVLKEQKKLIAWFPLKT